MESMSTTTSRQGAIDRDAQDPLRHFRQEFLFPTRRDLQCRTLKRSTAPTEDDSQPDGDGDDNCIYLCGNSLGLQPRCTASYVTSHLQAWAMKGVHGHFSELEDSPVVPFLHMDDQAAKLIAPIVGALPHEVAIMETLTANLHILMASFYRPNVEKYKIIIEGKSFPSDHYAVESQIMQHGFSLEDAMVLIEPESADEPTISTEHILSVIDAHASKTAMILLPGVQYYTGQYLDIGTITRHAHSHGILIGWDLAHAVGNVPLTLHDWDVDFAAWCSYKYLNSGPGAIAGLFVHTKHGEVDTTAMQEGKEGFRPRLSGWWGGDKSIRFQMANKFVPIPGAQGYQLGNPSSLALAAVIASLEIFGRTSVDELRKKSLELTQYLQDLLLAALDYFADATAPYRIITPLDPNQRGAQLSVQLKPGYLPLVMASLDDAGVVLDERKPDVIRVAPAPLYNTFEDVWRFVEAFKAACTQAQQHTSSPAKAHKTTMTKGQAEKGFSQIQ